MAWDRALAQLADRLYGDAHRRTTRPRRVGHAFPLVLLAALAALSPLAYASPPDPAWIQGIYDDADNDDIVVLLTDTLAATALPPPALAPLSSPLVVVVAARSVVTVTKLASLARRLRSPPAA